MAQAFNAVANTVKGAEPSGAAAMLSDAVVAVKKKQVEKTQRYMNKLKRRNEHIMGVARSHGVSEEALRVPQHDPHDETNETGSGKRAWPR